MSEIHQLRSESAQMTFSNIEAEQSVLGSILMDNRALDMVGDIVRPEFFSDPVHQRIFEVASGRVRNGHLVSPITMKLSFEGDEGLKALGGSSYFARLAGASMISAVRDYAKQITEAYCRRALHTSAAEAASMLSEGRDSLEVKMAVQRAISALPDGGEASSYSLAKSVTEAAERAVLAYQGETSFLKTGLPSLDRIIRGLAPGDMCLVCGATSMGKTSLALEVASNVAYRGEGVAFVSLEMTRHELATRMISARARVPYTDLRDPSQMQEAEFRKWIEATQDVAKASMRIIPKHVRDIPAIYSAVKQAGMDFKGGKPSLVVVDYAQLVRGAGKGRYEQMTEVSIGLKQLAGMLEVPLIALCQLSRDIGTRDDKRPQLSDIKETGQFENDADQVVFCHREGYWLERQGPRPDKSGHITEQARNEWQTDIAAVKNVMELIVRKNRHGRLATAEVGFHDATNRFWELGKQEQFDGY